MNGKKRTAPGFIASYVTTCALGFAPMLLPAQESSESTNEALDEIIVTATRMDTELGRTPAAVSVVGIDDIQLGRQQLNLDESLSRVPGVYMQSNYNFSRDLRLSIRGFGARAAFGIRGVKIIVDGIPETVADGQGQVDTIDFGTARQIEVIRGPSSSLYGNASGGVVSVISEGGTETPYATARLSAGAFDFRKVQVKTGGTAGPMDYVVSLADTSLDGYRDHAEWENTQLSGRFNFDLAGDANFLAVVNYTDQPISNDPGGIDAAQAAADPRSARGRNVQFDAGEALEQTRVGFVYTLPIADEHELAVRTYHVDRDFANKLPFQGGGAVEIDRTFTGGGVSYTHSGMLQGRPNRLIVGLDFDDQDDDRRRFDNLDGILGPLVFDQNERVKARGVFIQDELSLSDTISLTAGLRYDEIDFDLGDRYLVDGDDSGSRTLDNVNPMLGIVADLTPELTLYSTYSTAFESPTTTEFANPTGGGGFNPDLEPQEATNLEVGVRGRLGQTTTYEAALYNIDVKDELIPFETATREYFVNAGKSDPTGLELSLQSEPFDNVRVVLSYTYSDFEFDEFVDNDGNVFSGNTLPGIPEHFLFGEVSYRHPSGFFGIFDLRFVDDLFANNGNTVSVDSYTLGNFRVGMERSMGPFIASPFIGINNLFDESYNSDIRITGSESLRRHRAALRLLSLSVRSG